MGPANGGMTFGDSFDESALPLQPQRVLVADDQANPAENLRAELAQLGYEVLELASSGKAVELASSDRPHMAVVEVSSGQEDGLEAAKILSQQMHLPVVIISDQVDNQSVEAAASVGAFGYLVKPVNMDNLRTMLPMVWKRYREQMRLRNEVHDLEVKLENRKIVEKAKGLLMKNLGLPEDEAMRRLQKQARDSRCPMVDLARTIVDTQDLLSFQEKKS